MFFGLDRAWRRFRFRFHRSELEQSLSEELELHAALKTQDHVRAGMPIDAAAAEVRREMGNATLAKEESRDHWSFMSFEQLAQDVRYALRMIRGNPGFSSIAILSLALGIAGSTAIFSFVNALLIRPLAFKDPDALVRITEFYPKALLVHLRQQSRTLEIGSASSGRETNFTGMGPAVRVTECAISANLFPLLGVSPERGRTFETSEDHPGRDDVVILSDSFWRSQLRADPYAVGRVITLNGRNRRIVGIMEPRFAFPSARVQLWIPSVLDPTVFGDYWGGEYVPLIARLRPGATIEQAQNEIHALAANVWTLFPFPMPRHFNSGSTVIPLQRDLAGDNRPRLLLLFSAVITVLVVSSVNVAGLLLARATTRRREMALRAALGAGRFRIVRQLLTESVVLAGVAGIAGLALGSTAMELFGSVISRDMPGAGQIHMDWQVVGFAAALAMVTGLMFGMVPALSASRIDLMGAMRTGGQRSTTGKWIQLRGWLIAGEVALTLVLVIGAGLLITSLHSLMHVNPGFATDRIFTMKISPDRSYCDERAACIAFYDRMLTDSRAVAGVIDAAFANTVPLDRELPSIPVDVEDHPKSADFPAPMLWTGAITPGYLRLMQIPLISGRELSAADSATSAPVILITPSTANRFWPSQNPIGKHIKFVSEKQWRTIVGVVADVRQFDLANRIPGAISGALYMPYSQAVGPDQRIPAVMDLVVKTAGPAMHTSDELHSMAARNNPNIPVSAAQPLDFRLTDSVATVRSTTWIFLSFAGVALVLATIGIYGTVAYTVTQRTYEISLRMAIGATNGSIVGMIVSQSLRFAVVGIAVGLAGAAIVLRSLSSLLYGITTTDPRIFAAVTIFTLVLAVVASSIPAWRVSRIDPIRTLRSD